MKSFVLEKRLYFDDTLLTNAGELLNDKPYLLNTKEIGNNIIENFIYNIANHLCNINNSSDTFIEFKFHVEKLSPTNNTIADNIHSYDNTDNADNPNISCLTFLNNSKLSFITGNIKTDEYKYKNISDKKIDIVMHNKFNHIIYDSNNIYSFGDLSSAINEPKYDNDESITLFVFSWNKKPNLPIFSYDSFRSEYYSKYKDKLLDVVIQDERVLDINNNSECIINIKNNNDLLIKNMLYNDDNKYISILVDSFKGNMVTNASVISFIPVCQTDIEGVCSLKEGQRIDVYSSNKYIQRYIIPNILNRVVCDWIISEYNKYANNNGGWLTDRHPYASTTDLLIDKVPCILNLMLSLFKNIITPSIIKHYSLPVDSIINIIDLFIVKYEKDKQEGLERHRDESNFTASISLNDMFDGGGVKFDDGSIVIQNPGELLIMTNRDVHSAINITRGERYVIIFFINIY
jgi:hypothetical protein